MWFSRVRFGTLLLDIFEAASLDGTSWVANEAGSAWDSGGIETPSVVKVQNQLIMYYTGYPSGFRRKEDSHLIGRAVFNASAGAAVEGPDGKTRVFSSGWRQENPNGPDQHGVGVTTEP